MTIPMRAELPDLWWANFSFRTLSSDVSLSYSSFCCSSSDAPCLRKLSYVSSSSFCSSSASCGWDFTTTSTFLKSEVLSIMLFECSVSNGTNFSDISSRESDVSQLSWLKNTSVTFLKVLPDFSNARIVLSNVGASVFDIMLAISLFSSSMPYNIASS